MIDPLKGIPLIQDAYAASRGEDIAPADDIVYGTHFDGCEHVFGIVREGRLGIRGTQVFGGFDFADWINDFMVIPESTPFGNVARGPLAIYRSFRTKSGRNIGELALIEVHAHSLGAGIGALISVALNIPHVLWACPNWFCPHFAERFQAIEGIIFSNHGDVVPLLPPPVPFINPRLGPITHLDPRPAPADFDGLKRLEYHHAFSTYCSAYEATLTHLQ